MKRFLNFTVVVIILILTAILANAQIELTGEKDFSKLDFSIKTTKEKFLLAEPIPIILDVKNETGILIPGDIDLGFMAERIEVFVERPDQTIIKVKPLSLLRGCSACEKKQPILPNSRYEKKEIIQDFVEKSFDRPGKYKIWAEFCSRECSNAPYKTVSNSITIIIAEPIGKNKEAYLRYNELFQLKWELSRQSFNGYVTSLESFVENYLNTPYGDYIASEIGRLHAGFKRFEKAQNYFQKISSNYVFKVDIEKIGKNIEQELKEKRFKQF